MNGIARLPRAVRRLALAPLIVLLAALAGCAPEGRDAAALRAELERVPGVVRVDLESARTQNGLDPARTAVDAVLVLAEPPALDAPAALEYLLRLAWSVGPARPSALFVGIDRTDGTSFLDLAAGADALGVGALVTVIDRASGAGREVAMVRLDDGTDPAARQRLLDLLGPWPGEAPAPPAAFASPGETGPEGRT